jgi:ankyrin repeat protein
MVKMLLSQKASAKIESRAIDGSSSLHAAAVSGNREILMAILSAGAKIHISAEDASKQTPLHLAVTLVIWRFLKRYILI